MHVGVQPQPSVPLGLVRIQIVENDVNLAAPVVRDHVVHEIEKLSPPAPIVVSRPYLAGGHIQSRK